MGWLAGRGCRQFAPREHGRPLQRFRFMPDFDPSSVPLGVDEEVGDTPPGTIRAARQTERSRHPQQQPEQGLGDAWILIGFIVVLGLIFVVAAWVLAGSR
jgi:hypothetical protein